MLKNCLVSQTPHETFQVLNRFCGQLSTFFNCAFPFWRVDLNPYKNLCKKYETFSTDFSAMFACSWFVPRVWRFPRIFVWTTWPETLWPRVSREPAESFTTRILHPLPSQTALRLQWKGMSQKGEKGGRDRIPWQKLIFA